MLISSTPEGWLRAATKALGVRSARGKADGGKAPGSREQGDRGPETTVGHGVASGYLAAKRALDLMCVAGLTPVVALPFVTVAILVKVTSRGPVFYVSNRVGKDEALFKMYKFRSMKADTPAVATHLLQDAGSRLTSIGGFLRRTSLDELPQLINIARGEMTLVGPRPALFNQDDLISLRRAKGVNRLVPGLTGWAQINGRDEIPIPKKVELDAHYLESRGLLFDLRILAGTVRKVVFGAEVTH